MPTVLVKKVLLTEWAEARYKPVPPKATLRRWAREGRFSPPAELAGKDYRVLESAVLIGAVDHNRKPLVDRI